MSPAELVINRFNGVRPLARLLDVDHSSVVRWPQPKPRGLGGTIPSRHHAKLLELAKAHKIKLTASELIYGDTK